VEQLAFVLSLAAVVLFFASGCVVSVRLILLWQRTRKLPELAVALALLGIGPLGFCLMALGRVLYDQSAPAAFGGAGLAIQNLGFAAALVFTWQVFRPDAAWAGALALAGIAGLGGTLALLAASPDEALGVAGHSDIGLKIATLCWASLESLRYWLRMRKRVAVGLTLPLVANRFLLWGFATACGAAAFAIVDAGLVWVSIDSARFAWLRIGLSLFGIAASVCLWLAFVPPESYRRYIASTVAEKDW
jgi:hypothetical protein